jgi:hypothetical protein
MGCYEAKSIFLTSLSKFLPGTDFLGERNLHGLAQLVCYNKTGKSGFDVVSDNTASSVQESFYCTESQALPMAFLKDQSRIISFVHI